MNIPEDNDIRDRAYALWQQDGSPAGKDQEYWHRAERELSQEAGLDTSKDSAEVTQPTPPAGLPIH